MVFLTLAGATLIAGAAPGEAAGPDGGEVALRFALIENQHQAKEEFLAELTLANRGGAELARGDWALYFNFGRPLRPAGEAAQLAATHVNGDLWKLEPTERFTPIAPGEERVEHLLDGGQPLDALALRRREILGAHRP